MTQNAFQVMRFILAWGWRFFTGYYIPGTNVTPGAMLLFVAFSALIIDFTRRMFNVTASSRSSAPRQKSSKGGD